MSELNENTITLLSSTAGCLMRQSEAPAYKVLYTVPSGKTAVIVFVVVRNPSASLALCTVISFGNESLTYTNWNGAISLANLTTVSTSATVMTASLPTDTAPSLQRQIVCAAGTEFSMVVTTSTVAAGTTATIDVFGYLY